MKFVLALLFTVLGLSGCLPGNAEGYGKKPNSPAGDNAAPGAAASASYYLLDPSYTCLKEGSDTPIPSYRDSIIYQGGTIAFQMGDRCRSKKVEIPVKELTFSKLGQYLGYKDEIYLYINEAITDVLLGLLRPVEALCTAIDPKTDEIFDIAIRKPVKPEDKLTAHVQFVALDVIVEVSRTEDTTTRKYLSAEIELSIGAFNSEYLQAAMLTSHFSSPPLVQDLNCRLSDYP